MNKIDLTGNRFGKLKVVSLHGKNKFNNLTFYCECDCGNTKIIDSNNLRRGLTKSCGCIQREITSKAKTKHGLKRAPEYLAWKAMTYRCSSKCKGKIRENYYDRGIRVAEEWLGVKGALKFVKYIGKRPSIDHSVDRINVDGHYEPGNVRWATKSEQISNRRKIRAIQNFSYDEFAAEAIRRGFEISKIYT